MSFWKNMNSGEYRKRVGELKSFLYKHLPVDSINDQELVDIIDALDESVRKYVQPDLRHRNMHRTEHSGKPL